MSHTAKTRPQSTTPSALIRYSNVLRDKVGPELSQALIAQSRDLDALHSFVDSISGFSEDKVGNISIYQLDISRLKTQFHFEDPPDIQYVAAAGYRIPLLGEWMRLSNTSGGALTLTSVPTIAAAANNGQRLELLNVSANNIVLQDNGTLAGSTLRLGAATRTLGTRDSIALRWSSDIGGWCERWFSNVL